MINTGKLEKAQFIRYQRSGDRHLVAGKLNVQFNPSEYSIERSVNHSKKTPLYRDTSPDYFQTVSGGDATLNIKLYFDSYTPLSPATPRSGIPNIDPSVNNRIKELLSLIKYDHEDHEPPRVGFVWGSLFFVGNITRQQTQYTLFSQDGTPVRAQMTLTITGEEAAIESQVRQYPMESPDRTKVRWLRSGDSLWLMAQEEYGDVSMWKDIAQANEILNPRAITDVKLLKVPAKRYGAEN